MKRVFLLLPGPSLEKIKPILPLMKTMDARWTSLNRFSILQRKLDLRFDEVYVSSPVRFSELKEDIYTFMLQGGVFITNSDIYNNNSYYFECIRHVKDDVAYMLCDLAYEPGIWHNSLTAYLLHLSKNRGVDEIYLFGCDGGMKPGEPVYFGQEMIPEGFENYTARNHSIPRDTELMNREFWGLYNTYNVEHKPRIINVNDDSLVTCFETMKWEDFYAFVNETSKEGV